jgi:Cutinase/PKD domain/Fibronectin type III domain/RTX calcium-binding nonapeptide repeat (4 copies)/von Willebrand factor type A domain
VRRKAFLVPLLALFLSAIQLVAHGDTALVAQAQSTPCTDVRIVGVRGSGESYDASDFGMGKLLGPVYKMLLARAPATTSISAYGIPYQAVAIADWRNINPVRYRNSVQDGRDKLDAYLREIASSCPDQKIVLLGYSQGAQVIGSTLANNRVPASVTSKIAAITFFGDPKFDSRASYARGSFQPKTNGILLARPLSELAPLADRMRSYCRGLDIVCQGLTLGASDKEHAQDKYVSEWGAFAAKWAGSKLAWPDAPAVPFGGKIDVAFVIDSTGSMASSIGAAQESARSIVGTLAGAGADFRVALADYKDVDQGDPYSARIDLAFTNQADAFGSAVNSLSATGGGDTPEAVYSGIMAAIQDLTWRNGAKKVIVLMGDAPAKDPEPTTGFTRASVLAAARALDPASIYGIVVGDGAREDFEALAAGSDGDIFEGSDPAAVSSGLLDAVEAALQAPVAMLTAPKEIRLGQTVTLSAAGSDDPDGSIVAYQWDFNDDGVIDSTTSDPFTSHLFDAAYEGSVVVRVRDNDGQTATAFVDVTVSTSAATAATAPRGVQATAGNTTATVRWTAPANDGGSPIVGYLVQTTDGEPVGFVEDPTTSLTVADLVNGLPYSFIVTAYNAIGASSPSEASAPVVPTNLSTTRGCTIRGTAGNDVLRGTDANDVICGGGGNDHLKGGGGNDRLVGGPGNDRMFGGPGNDRLQGGTGRDWLDGGKGRDRCSGGPGADRAIRCEVRA